MLSDAARDLSSVHRDPISSWETAALRMSEARVSWTSQGCDVQRSASEDNTMSVQVRVNS